MNYLIKRTGLLIYGLLSLLESMANFAIYVTHIDFIIKPMDWSVPFYFWYINKFLKGSYISNLKNQHGQNI